MADEIECPVILDGDQAQDDGLAREVGHKLDGLKVRKRRPWTSSSKRLNDHLSVLEENDENNDDGQSLSEPKSRNGLLTPFKSSDGKQSPRGATFKPIRLAVAKARYVDESDASAAVPRISRPRETTLTLPDPGVDVPAASADVLDGIDNDDATSYIEFPQGPSPTITRTSSASTAVSPNESESTMRHWLPNPFNKSNQRATSTTTSPTTVPDELPDTPGAANSSIYNTTTTKWKAPKKLSRNHSQKDLDETPPQVIDYAEIDTTRPAIPNRTDTMRSMLSGNQDSLRKNRSNTLRLPIPFRGRRRNRRGKGRTREDDSSSDDAIDDGEIFEETLRRAGLFDKDVPEQSVTEALWQNERGIHFLGSRYGGNALIPGDPKSWTDLHGNAISYNTSNFPLPTPAWRWFHSEWLISMIGDVDSEGYQYSTRFTSKYWRGIPEIRFFVRRRLWVRTRYRPALKAQAIAKFTRPQAGQTELGCTSPQAGLPNASVQVPALHEASAEEELLFLPVLASRLDLRNPFISWYDLKKEYSTESNKQDKRLPLKHEVIHANFVRVAKVLVRRTHVDRERLAWLEYWLGAREDALHITDVQAQKRLNGSQATNAVIAQQQSGVKGGLTDIEEDHPSRPDVRDVWDLLEDQLDKILGLFEYQETRRELLMLLKKLHNTSHPEHHYKNRSTSSEYPSEILAQHSHGVTDEMGADANSRAVNGDGTHATAERRPRLAFWTDLNDRLRDIQVTTALADIVGKQKSMLDEKGLIGQETDDSSND